ncbi:hypothetical protein BY458DRAFT_288686 [Sporodiniella umbellata]|nr:hypothetical protein BY458DRAFT_288686 [Sporodiniella umbellata]
MPRSTEELERLSNISVDPNIPVKLYFRSAELLLKQARIYRLENDLEHAYLLYMKYTNLGLTALPEHPSYRKVENKKSIKILNKNCLEALEALESIKPRLDENYKNFNSQNQTKTPTESLVIDNAQHEKNCKTPAKDIDPYAPSSPSLESLSCNLKEWSLQEALEGVQGVGPTTKRVEDSQKPHTSYIKTDYPSLNLPNQSDQYKYQASPRTLQTLSPPSLPPKIPYTRQSYQPAVPPKIPFINNQPELSPKMKQSSGPTVDASSQRGEPLRKLILPHGLHAEFLSIARSNTHNKIETCGILAGKLKNNTLSITTLIIPKQTGTTDTCTMENEEELFDIQDKHDLLTFGWIHTHPTQSCFLSSVDLHTHCSYQLMLPEAIAVVCSPTQSPDFGIFRLTDPPGLDVISNCKKQPAFHPHPDLPIYTDVVNNGHVQLLSYNFDIMDLRK